MFPVAIEGAQSLTRDDAGTPRLVAAYRALGRGRAASLAREFVFSNVY